MDTKDARDKPTGGAAPVDRAARRARADTVVKDHVLLNAAASLIPVPGLDLAVGIAVQVAMLKRLTNLYGVPFSENAAGALIMAMLGRLGAGTLGGGLLLTAVKLVPGAWPFLALVSPPIAIGAVTYALGNVFIAHLEVGGVLTDFDLEANHDYFKNLIKRGRQVAATLSLASGY